MNKLEDKFIAQGCLFANAKTCVEITTDVAIKFLEWMASVTKKYQRGGTYVVGITLDNTKTWTAKELFEEFINNHYGKDA